MARRENGSGNIRRDPARPGSWIGAVQVDGRRYTARGKTKTDVAAKLTRLQAEAITGTGKSRDDRKLTVAQTIEQFLTRDVPNRDLAPATIEYYRWAGDLIIDGLGKVRLADLTVGHVERFLDGLSKRPVAPLGKATLTKVRGALQRAIAFAERRGQVARNVARLATLPAGAKATTPRSALQPDDARKLLVALREPYVDDEGAEQLERNGVMFVLGLRLGLRPGEAAGLYWDDVDLDSDPATVNVTRGVQMVGGKAVVVDDLKTAGSKRTLALPPDLVDDLRRHRASQLRERMAAPSWRDDRLVFTSPTGNVLSPPNVRRQLVAVCKRAGTPAVRPNELRHSCASLLSDEGVGNELIADLLGHTTTRMVDQTYRHRLRPVVDVATRATWTAAEG